MQSTPVVLMGILRLSLWSLLGLSHRAVAFCISHWGGSFCLVWAKMSWASEAGSTKKREEIFYRCSDSSLHEESIWEGGCTVSASLLSGFLLNLEMKHSDAEGREKAPASHGILQQLTSIGRHCPPEPLCYEGFCNHETAWIITQAIFIYNSHYETKLSL